MTAELDDPVTVNDFEAIARASMAPGDYELVASRSPGNLTIERTRAAWDAIAFRPRVLPAVQRPDLRLTLLGVELELPVLLAPCGYLTRAHPDGEEAAARAAGVVGTVFTAAANPGRPLEAIAAAAPGRTWFQTYLFQDRAETERRVRLAEAAGYAALVLTLDATWPAKRESRARRRATSGHGAEASRARLSSEPAGADRRVPHRVLPDPARNWADPRATWDDVAWFRSLTRLPIVAKGILDPDDAAAAARAGLDAILVSSHGGRLDNVIAPIEVLPEIVSAAAGREVLLDSGVRRGADVVKALALGARAVLIGRPIFWGLAAGGEAGLVRLLDILREEIELTLMLTGRPRLADLDPGVVSALPGLPPAHARA